MDGERTKRGYEKETGGKNAANASNRGDGGMNLMGNQSLLQRLPGMSGMSGTADMTGSKSSSMSGSKSSSMPGLKSSSMSQIPADIKARVERKSGLSMDPVNVHYRSPLPEKVGALAYTKGTDVYIGPGQERHLAHELGHVVQQLQGRVRPTGKVAGQPLNDDTFLEREADSYR